MLFLLNFKTKILLDALNKFPIYLLSMKKQKMMILLINRMQNAEKMQMGPLTELNYDTGSRVSAHNYTILIDFLLGVLPDICNFA